MTPPKCPGFNNLRTLAYLELKMIKVLHSVKLNIDYFNSNERPQGPPEAARSAFWETFAHLLACFLHLQAKNRVKPFEGPASAFEIRPVAHYWEHPCGALSTPSRTGGHSQMVLIAAPSFVCHMIQECGAARLAGPPEAPA